MELFKRNDTIIVKRFDDHNTLIIRSYPEGVFFCKVWKLPAYSDNPERLETIRKAGYKAKIQGFEVYVTLENYSGIDSLTAIYNPQEVVNQAAIEYYHSEIEQRPNKYKGSRTHP